MTKSLKFLEPFESEVPAVLSTKLYATWPQISRADPCVWCNGQSNTLDHVWPRGRDREGLGRRRAARLFGLGARTGGPYVGACQQCNTSRSDRTVLEFLIVRAMAFGVIRGPLPTRKIGPGRRWRDYEAERRTESEFGAKLRDVWPRIAEIVSGPAQVRDMPTPGREGE